MNMCLHRPRTRSQLSSSQLRQHLLRNIKFILGNCFDHRDVGRLLVGQSMISIRGCSEGKCQANKQLHNNWPSY
jgi:hypothetical protein